jgi:hypothetical protein
MQQCANCCFCAPTRNATSVHECCFLVRVAVLLRLVNTSDQRDEAVATDGVSPLGTLTAVLRGQLTLSVPQAGSLIYGIGRDAAYAAACRGEIPTIRLGKTVRVLTHAALRDVGLTNEHIAMVLGISVQAMEGDAA